MKYLPLNRTKQSHPFGRTETPFDPKTGLLLPLIPVAPIVQTVLIEAEGGEFLTCIDGSSNKVIVAKPHMFRRFLFDGKTVNGVVYEYFRPDYRKATSEEDDTIVEFQFITPTYYAGEAISVIAVRDEIHIDDETKTVICGLLDLNTAGRCWAVGEEEEET